MLGALLADARPAATHAPHDDVADIAVSPAYAEDRTVFAIVRTKLMRSTDSGKTWTEIMRGLGDETQTLVRLAAAPSDSRILYLTTRGDGVLKSEDGGLSWRTANDGLENLRLAEIAVSPRSPDTVLAAGAQPRGGLFRTVDGGETWSTVIGFGHVTSLAFLPSGSRAIAGATGGRIMTSDDAGATWELAVTLDRGDTITAIATGTGPDAIDTVFAASRSGRLFRSDDGGRSFVTVGEGLPEEHVESLQLSPRYAEDTTLWASTWHSGVFHSTNQGESWEPVTGGLTTDPQADEVGLPQFGALAAGVDGLGETSLFVAGFDGLFRYDGREARWESIETLSDYIVGLAVSPDFRRDRTIAVTTYVKGAFMSRNGGDSWRLANEGLTVDEVGAGNKFAPLWRLHNVVFSPDFASDGTIFSATWVSIVKSTDRGASWKEVDVSAPPSGEDLRQFVLAVSPSYASDRTVFAATRHGEVFRSEDRGEPGTWTRVGGFEAGERVRSLAVSPHYADDRVLYAGTVEGVYVSRDGGETWHAAGPRTGTEPQGRETDPGAMIAISPAYGSDGTVFVGTNSGLFVTRDAGQSWDALVAPLTASSTIEAVAVSPNYEDDRTILVSTRELGLVRSTDAGASFHRVGTELFDANRLVADFSNPTSSPIQFSPTFAVDRTIFAYAQTDVVRSTDAGESWEILHLPSDDEVLRSLGFVPGSAGPTKQRGWFETPLGNLSLRRVLAAAGVGVTSFVALRVVGLGGRGTGRALALHLGSGVLAVGIALVALAA